MTNKYLVKITTYMGKVLMTEVCYGTHSDAVRLANSLINSYNYNVVSVSERASGFEIIPMI